MESPNKWRRLTNFTFPVSTVLSDKDGASLNLLAERMGVGKSGAAREALILGDPDGTQETARTRTVR